MYIVDIFIIIVRDGCIVILLARRVVVLGASALIREATGQKAKHPRVRRNLGRSKETMAGLASKSSRKENI